MVAIVRGTNNCEWLMRNRKEKCGKRCVGTYCRQHNYQLSKGMKIPAPCRSCGVGVLCDYRLCISCGGSALKHRLIRKCKKAKKAFELVLLELKTTQLERWAPHVISLRNVCCWAKKQLSTYQGHSRKTTLLPLQAADCTNDNMLWI